MASHSASTSPPRFRSFFPAITLLVAPVTAAVSSYSVNCIGPASLHTEAVGTRPRASPVADRHALPLVVPGCGADAPPLPGPHELQGLHPPTAVRRPGLLPRLGVGAEPVGDVAEEVRAAGDVPLPEVDERATREQGPTRGDELLDAVEHRLGATGPDDDRSRQEARPEVVEPGGELWPGGEGGEERPDDGFDLLDLGSDLGSGVGSGTRARLSVLGRHPAEPSCQGSLRRVSCGRGGGCAGAGSSRSPR